ncbi:RIP metalloprotease RseP, partial [bacterium]
MQILSVIVIIGVLVFVHELGHFLAAKWLKVPVKIFSIGFPLGNLPPLVKFNWGETECQLNILPLGGFCAFIDDEKDGERDPNDQKFLNNRKVWERFVVISGGVVFNFIFAIIVAVIMFFSLGIPEGREFTDGVVVLDIKGSSPAEKAGIKPLDTIVSVDNIPLNFEYDLNQAMNSIIQSKPDAKNADITYLAANGERVEKNVKLNADKTIGVNAEEVRGILVTQIIPAGPGEKAGIEKNDIITKIGDQNFIGVRNPEGMMKKVLADHTSAKPIDIQILRQGVTKTYSAVPDADAKLGVGIEYIKGLQIKNNDKAIDKALLPVNSIILEANKSPLYDISSVMKLLIAKHKDGTPANVMVKRQGADIPLSIVPDNTGVMGVQIQSAIKEIRRAPNSFFEPFKASFTFIANTCVLLTEALFRMFTGHMSLNEVGGPIMVV